MLKFLSLTLALLALGTGLVVAQVIHYQQNFDNLKEGPLDGQDGWAVGPPANMASPIITSDVNHGGPVGKSVEVNANQEVIRDFVPKIKSGVHFFSIWFRFENPGVGNNTLHIYIGDTVREWSAGPVIRIGGQSGGAPDEVGVHDGGDRKQIGKVRKGEWQHILEIIDVDAQTYDVYLDGQLGADDFSWRNPGNHKALGWLMIGFDGGQDLIGYYDDIVFGEGDKSVADDVLRRIAPVEAEGKLATVWGRLKTPY